MSARRALMLAAAFLLGLGAASAGFFVQRLFTDDEEQVSAASNPAPLAADAAPLADPSVVGQRRPDFTLPDPEGRPIRPADWDGKVLVINFWATWCPPCLEEMPAFMAVQAEYAGRGVQFLGIAVDEVGPVREFVARIGLNYPTVHGQADAMEVGRAYGNSIGALPFTAIVAADGRLVHTHAGALTREQIERLIVPLLAGT